MHLAVQDTHLNATPAAKVGASRPRSPTSRGEAERDEAGEEAVAKADMAAKAARTDRAGMWDEEVWVDSLNEPRDLEVALRQGVCVS